MAATATKKTAKSVTKAKKPRSYPSFYVMISDAIVSLKERTGSSQYAISKLIEQKYKKSSLPANFKKLLLVNLKKLVASGKLTKVKNSYKLAAAGSKPKAAPKVKAGEVKAKKAKTATAKTEKKKKKKATPVKKAPKRVKVAKKVTPKKAKK